MKGNNSALLRNPRARVRLAFGLFAIALVGAGCSSTTMRVYVDSTADTNGGLPFYAVIRAVDQAAYVTDTYEAVAGKVFVNPADPSVLRTEVIYPGIEREIEIKKPENLPIGIYFLFTKPGEKWKTAVRQPLPSTVEIELAGNQIKSEG